jgi:hypothetical protein
MIIHGTSLLLPTANVSIEAVQEVFDGCIIRRGLLPPHSPELTPCDFYLQGRLKDKV